jgi:hypothetical protein
MVTWHTILERLKAIVLELSAYFRLSFVKTVLDQYLSFTLPTIVDCTFELIGVSCADENGLKKAIAINEHHPMNTI